MKEMQKVHDLQAVQWASLAIITGGVLMTVFWIAFTSAHGPTSFDEDRLVFGRSMLFWGMLLGSLPNLLLAVGLIILHPRLANGANRIARVGYFLTVISLVVSGGLDLFYWRAGGPPFFVPVLGAGLILMALGSTDNPQLQRQSRHLLMLLGILLIIAFGWVLVPNELSDQVGGFRLYGLVASLATGIAWVMLGVNLWK